jgi:AcrR family transcriptional regulator
MPYHHGNLREALVDAGLATARVEGPDAVVLRAATRAAGVSPNAAYRHFADREELVGAVSAQCIQKLAELMEKRLSEVPPESDPQTRAWNRLEIAGNAYVEFALSEPGWFRTAFGSIQLSTKDAVPDERNPYLILNGILDELVDAGALPPERRPLAEFAAWASVHGISTLLLDGPLTDMPPEERDLVIAKVHEVVARGL